MTHVPATDLLRLVRRTRRRLESLRIAKASARGALAGGAAGLVLLLAGRFLGIPRVGPLVPWFVLIAGTLAAGGAAVLCGRSIRASDAALFLDDRLGTKGGLVTLLEMPAHPFAHRFAVGAAADARPRLPFPREIGLVPVALFLLFGAGLLPSEATVESPTPRAATPTVVASGAGAEAAPLPELESALAELRDRAPLSNAAAEAAQAHIDRRLHRPEDRLAARRELEGARAGDATAAKSLEQRLADGGTSAGAEGADGPRPVGAGTATNEQRRGRTSSPYPEAVELVRAYHRALAQRGQ